MPNDPILASARVARQRRAMLRIGLLRGSPIVALVMAGFLLSGAGLLARHAAGEGGKATAFLAFGVLYLGVALVAFGVGFARVRFRVVPYLARPIGPAAAAAFNRGAALVGALDAVDDLARSAGAAPLSSFGFEDDAYGQAVTWHPADAGLAAALAARRGWAAGGDPEVAADLDALVEVLHAAAASGVEFCLVLHAGDAQTVAHESGRQGVLR